MAPEQRRHDDDGCLSPRYRQALALEAGGCEPAEMAARLDVPVESLGSLLHLAHAKRAAAAPT